MVAMQVRPLFGSIFFGCLDLLDIYGKTSNCPHWQCLQQIAAIEHSTTPQAPHFSSCAPANNRFDHQLQIVFTKGILVLFSVVLIGIYLHSWAYMVAMQVRPLFGSVFFGCLDLLDIYGKTSNCPHWQCLQQIAAIEHSTTPQASHFSSCAPWPPCRIVFWYSSPTKPIVGM